MKERFTFDKEKIRIFPFQCALSIVGVLRKENTDETDLADNRRHIFSLPKKIRAKPVPSVQSVFQRRENKDETDLTDNQRHIFSNFPKQFVRSVFYCLTSKLAILRLLKHIL